MFSKLEGNYDGTYQASTGQLDPNINSAFDYADFLVNADGKLSNDRLFQFKRGFSLLRFQFSTLRLVTDEEMYRELTARRAQAAEVSVEEVSCGGFFPAYRTPF